MSDHIDDVLRSCGVVHVAEIGLELNLSLDPGVCWCAVLVASTPSGSLWHGCTPVIDAALCFLIWGISTWHRGQPLTLSRFNFRVRRRARTTLAIVMKFLSLRGRLRVFGTIGGDAGYSVIIFNIRESRSRILPCLIKHVERPGILYRCASNFLVIPHFSLFVAVGTKRQAGAEWLFVCVVYQRARAHTLLTRATLLKVPEAFQREPLFEA